MQSDTKYQLSITIAVEKRSNSCPALLETCMKLLCRIAFTTVAILASSAPSAQAPRPEATSADLPAEAFFSPTQQGPALLSPSGRLLGLVETNEEGRRQLKIIDLEGKQPPRIVARFQRFDVNWFHWLNEDWILYENYDNKQTGPVRGGAGLAAVTSDGKRFVEVRPRGWGYDIAGYGRPESNEIIFESSEYEATHGEFSHSVLLAKNVATHGVRTVLKGKPLPPGKIKGWLVDEVGQPRVAYTYEHKNKLVYWADPATGEWRKIGQFPLLDPAFEPLYVDEKDQLFVAVNNPVTHFAEIRQFNFSTGKPDAEVILALPGFDAHATPIRDPGSNKVYGLRTLTDARSVAWFSPEMARIQRKVDAMLPGRVNHVTCSPCAAPKVVLIHSYADNTPGSYLIYRVAEDRLERVVDQRPAHRTERMANMELYRTKARDGAELPVWVTKVEGQPAAPRPAVVLVHGGPWERATSWHWDPEAQFLATRGYVVIEPEFRGSVGYGDHHHRAGWKQWGQRMQDDVADALKFAVAKGWVDPNRVCIAGGSYGGYSALMGLAKDPGLYRCAVAWAAVSDPRMMYTVHWSDISDRSKEFTMPEMMGDLVKDADMLKANAPIELASRIKAPVMLAHGLLDRRIPIVYSEKLRTALTEAGNKPEWVVYDAEGHGWRRPETRIDFWRKVEAFLGKHLK